MVSSTIGAPGRSTRCASLRNAQQVVRREVLDDLRREQSRRATRPAGRADRSRRRRGVTSQAARAAHLDHLVIEVEAARGDAVLPQQLEKLAPAAADVEHIGGALRRSARSWSAVRGCRFRSAERRLERGVFPALRAPSRRRAWSCLAGATVCRLAGSALQRAAGASNRAICAAAVRAAARSPAAAPPPRPHPRSRSGRRSAARARSATRRVSASRPTVPAAPTRARAGCGPRSRWRRSRPPPSRRDSAANS